MVSLQNRQTIIAFATLAASIMLVRRIASAFVPFGVQRYFSNLHSFSSHFSTQLLTVVVEKDQRPEFNQLFQAADFYWGTLVTSSIIRGREAEEETAVDKDLEILDVFRNVKIRWKLVFTEVEQFDIEKINTTMQSGRRAYELTFHKEHKDTVLNLYLAYVLEQEKAIKEERRVQRFQKFGNRRWELDDTFEHTTNFKTLVMEPQLKKILLDDLNTFMSAQEKYRRIGKAWNRRYLLCGPPGTGKSDLIAAMANHLNYDIYKLDRTDFNIHYIMHHEVPSKSILVFKDIDCDVELQDQEYENGPENYDEHKRMMSLFLEATDGLWLSCSNELILVYMANNKAMLDPALLGRTDMHINMSYCTISTFKQLAFQYLAVQHHKFFEEIEGLIEDVEVAPEEVLRQLMKSSDIEASFQGLVKFLHDKKFNLEKPETSMKTESIEQKKERKMSSASRLERTIEGGDFSRLRT